VKAFDEKPAVDAAAEALVVLCSAPSEVAVDLARRLVESALAACVQRIDGMHAVYRWEGRIEEGTESLLLIKTTRSQFLRLRDQLAAWHPYDVPEILALPVAGGLPAYLEWLRQSTSS
jgi:periplasmic divalent cation tolerance protein